MAFVYFFFTSDLLLSLSQISLSQHSPSLPFFLFPSSFSFLFLFRSVCFISPTPKPSPNQHATPPKHPSSWSTELQEERTEDKKIPSHHQFLARFGVIYHRISTPPASSGLGGLTPLNPTSSCLYEPPFFFNEIEPKNGQAFCNFWGSTCNLDIFSRNENRYESQEVRETQINIKCELILRSAQKILTRLDFCLVLCVKGQDLLGIRDKKYFQSTKHKWPSKINGKFRVTFWSFYRKMTFQNQMTRSLIFHQFDHVVHLESRVAWYGYPKEVEVQLS